MDGEDADNQLKHAAWETALKPGNGDRKFYLLCLLQNYFQAAICVRARPQPRATNGPILIPA
jgi:hypothetical protein